MIQPLMPKATAVWLVENTALTFDQIADFCGLHVLEVKGIADGDVAQGIKGMDPIVSGQLSRSEIERCQNDPATRLMRAESKYKVPPVMPRKGPRYTPVSRRQDRPDAVAWLLRNHPELTDAQISKLVGTTKPTIESIRERTHWNSANIKPVDPVTLGLSTQIELDAAVQKAGRKLERERKKADKLAGRTSETLLPASETTAPEHATIAAPETKPEDVEAKKSYDADSVFASLKDVKIEDDDED
ncbi:MAG: cell cycle transcriptional regulator TrcR [Parvibaculum sp.]